MNKKRWLCPSRFSFFGLASNYRGVLQDEIFDLMYYGKMGFTYSDLWNMPTHIRRYFYRKLADIKKKEHEAEKEAYDKAKSGKR